MGHFVGNATFQCLHCRLAQRAEVRTIMLPTPGTRGAGHANTSLATLLALKHCPRCGHFDRQIAAFHRHAVRVALIGYLGLAALIALSLFAIPAVPSAVFFASLGALGAGFVALTLFMRRRFPTDVEARVQLIGSTAHNQQWF